MNSTDPADANLNEEDFRAVVRLLGKVAVGPESSHDKRKMLMDGLCEIIGADAWIWAVAPKLTPSEQPVYATTQTGGFLFDRFSQLLLAVEHPDTGAMTSPFIAALEYLGTHITRVRQQIIPDDRFESSPAYALWQAAGVGPIILSARTLARGGTSFIAMYRDSRKPPFTIRESKIGHILLTEVDWLHDEGLPHEESRSLPGLAPRCRLVFQQLLFGKSRKESAGILNLSQHTINDYVKEIFRHFKVHSVQELITRFCVGDGRDVA
jgi:DNA-binding CsgD family transcriptional regulator